MNNLIAKIILTVIVTIIIILNLKKNKKSLRSENIKKLKQSNLILFLAVSLAFIFDTRNKSFLLTIYIGASLLEFIALENKQEDKSSGFFVPGDLVIYAPKDNEGNIFVYKYGVFKKYSTASDEKAFVWYHSGCTASGTNLEDLYSIEDFAKVKTGFLLREGYEFKDIHKGCKECY